MMKNGCWLPFLMRSIISLHLNDIIQSAHRCCQVWDYMRFTVFLLFPEILKASRWNNSMHIEEIRWDFSLPASDITGNHALLTETQQQKCDTKLPSVRASRVGVAVEWAFNTQLLNSDPYKHAGTDNLPDVCMYTGCRAPGRLPHVQLHRDHLELRRKNSQASSCKTSLLLMSNLV